MFEKGGWNDDIEEKETAKDKAGKTLRGSLHRERTHAKNVSGKEKKPWELLKVPSLWV